MSESLRQLLERDHESLATLLQEFEALLAAEDLALAFDKLDLFWARLAMHIRSENLCLFPALLQAADVTNQHPTPDETRAVVAALREDHNFFMDSLAKAVKIMRDIVAHPERDRDESAGTVRDTVAAVKVRLDTHNIVEEEKLYRWPSMLMNETEMFALESDIKRQLENFPARYSDRK